MAAIAGIGLLIGNRIVSALIIGLPERLRIRRRSSRVGFRGWLYVLIRRRRGRISGIVVHGIEHRYRHKSPGAGLWTAKMNAKTLIAPEPNLVAGSGTWRRR